MIPALRTHCTLNCRALCTFVSIEGNIGAGKSTLLQIMKAQLQPWTFIDEPVNLWSTLKNDDSKSLLETFYCDPKRWSFTFQACALLSRYQSIAGTIEGNHESVLISERCLETDYNVFAKKLHADGSMCSLEFQIYEKYFHQLRQSSIPLSAIIYVDTSPQVCLHRIQRRARGGENGITQKYLMELDNFTKQWIETANVPTLRLHLENTDDDCLKAMNFIREISRQTS